MDINIESWNFKVNPRRKTSVNIEEDPEKALNSSKQTLTIFTYFLRDKF